MKKIFKTLGIQLSLFLFFISSFGIIYAAWNDTVNSGDPLTAESWNEVVDRVQVFDVSGGNVSLGGTANGNKLQISTTGADGLDVLTSGTSNFNTTFFAHSTGAPKAFIVRGSGNVGIGTTSPTDNLQIESLDTTVLGINTVGGESDDRAILAFDRDGAQRWDIGVNTNKGGNNNLYIRRTDSPSSYVMTFTQSNNVGIGNLNPGSKLSVVGLPSGTNLSNAGLDSTPIGAVCIAADGDMYIDTDGVCN